MRIVDGRFDMRDVPNRRTLPDHRLADHPLAERQPADQQPAGQQGVESALRRLGFDSDHAAYVTYHVIVGTWEQAAAMSRHARRDGWHGSIFVDRTRWVVRLVCYLAPTPEIIDHTCRDVGDLAFRYRGQPRGFSIEDPVPVDCWAELAARVVGPSEDAEHEVSWITSRVHAQRACS